MNLFFLIFLFPGILIGSYGSLFLKKGSKYFSLNPMKIIKNKEILFGLFLYGISMILYIAALNFGKVSVVYPLCSLAYVLISFLSIKYLNEKMNIYKWTGIIFIILGSFLIIN